MGIVSLSCATAKARWMCYHSPDSLASNDCQDSFKLLTILASDPGPLVRDRYLIVLGDMVRLDFGLENGGGLLSRLRTPRRMDLDLICSGMLTGQRMCLVP